MTHGFHACNPVMAHDFFYGFGLIARYGAADSEALADGVHTLTRYES